MCRVWFYLPVCALDLVDLLAVRRPTGPPTRALGSDFLHASRRTYVIVTKPADGPIGERLNFEAPGNYSYASSKTLRTGSDRIGSTMIVLGIILLLIGYFTSLSILYTIGGILVVVGIVLWILGAVGRPVGGRKVWF